MHIKYHFKVKFVWDENRVDGKLWKENGMGKCGSIVWFKVVNSCVSVTTTTTWLRGRKNPKVQVFNSRPTKIGYLKIVHMYIYIITISYSSDIQCNYMMLNYWFKYCFDS